jgi:hypothetical protein
MPTTAAAPIRIFIAHDSSTISFPYIVDGKIPPKPIRVNNMFSPKTPWPWGPEFFSFHDPPPVLHCLYSNVLKGCYEPVEYGHL